MMDVHFYRDAVLEIILSGQHIAREVYELRCSLYLRAANYSYAQETKKSEVFEPFPHCFFDFVTKTRRDKELWECITNIPDLNTINEATSLPELTWELLHWIFTNPLNIKVVKESEISEYQTDELRTETKLMSIPYPSRLCNRFKITHQKDINSTNEFLKLKNEFGGSFYAYHGSPGHNFHSIIHRGLRCSLNVRAAHGPGTYLSSYLETATSYATQFGTVDRGYNPGNLNITTRIRYCVAIVEVIKHPSIKIVNIGGRYVAPTDTIEPPNFDDTSSDHHRYYIVNSDALMRLKHLLVFY